MFEAAELGRKTPKPEYKARVPVLRAELLEVQRRLLEARVPVIVVFAGVDGAGKGETVNLLNEWMDPRWIVTHAFGDPSDEELERPAYWRYWRALPPAGRIGLFLQSWYSKPLIDRAYRRTTTAEFDAQLHRIADFEKTLADGGALILKYWMHLDRESQRKRLKTLEKDPLTRWRVTNLQWKHWGMYGRFIATSERTIRRTSTGDAPWRIVEGVDERYRSLAVGTGIRDAIRRRLNELSARRAAMSVAVPKASDKNRRPADAKTKADEAQRRAPPTLLSRLNMDKKVDKAKFGEQLERYQGDLNLFQRRAGNKGVSTILVFEGWDAAGKGGAIRRVTGALDARAYQVIPIAAPTDEERAHHYLWRFWRHLSRAGRVTIFDRSWYGRVLVERVEGFATPNEWMRAYSEINQFEDQLVERGIVLVKFWMHVTQDEQLRRFKDRRHAEYKRWKLTDEDWRNRKKWFDYEVAVNEMVERTSTRKAPWTLIEGNDKNYARLKVLRTVSDALKRNL
jgi:polyphosphate:AMP phosphotransferase